VEHSFSCPHCGEEISMVLDLSVRKQTYVEDCEVCCQPIEISYTVADEELEEFSARTLGWALGTGEVVGGDGSAP
jgi:transcription elongation factor Elf1